MTLLVCTLTFTKWLTEFPTELTNMKPTLFLPVLKLVMQRNVFQFDNTYWHQMDGTAMGASTACLYAALYYAYHKKRQLIPKFGHRLLYLKRFIDDGLGIWLGEADAEWDSFINEVDNFGKLRWTNTGLVTEVDFLDLTIQIDDHRNVRTKTFCKPMNLFLYIPPRSAHPPGVLCSTILGNLSRFYQQNSSVNDFVRVTKAFVHHLERRGHSRETLLPLFREAAQRLDLTHSKCPACKRALTKQPRKKEDPLFLHLEYHPRGPSQAAIRNIYNKTLKGHDGFDRMIIAYRRPRNIRDALMKTQLREPPGEEVSRYIDSNYPTTFLLANEV